MLICLNISSIFVYNGFQTMVKTLLFLLNVLLLTPISHAFFLMDHQGFVRVLFFTFYMTQVVHTVLLVPPDIF